MKKTCIHVLWTSIKESCSHPTSCIPVLKQPVVFSVGWTIPNDDHSVAQSVAIAIGYIQDPIGIKLHEVVDKEASCVNSVCAFNFYHFLYHCPFLYVSLTEKNAGRTLVSHQRHPNTHWLLFSVMPQLSHKREYRLVPIDTFLFTYTLTIILVVRPRIPGKHCDLHRCM